ncbi:MAG: putative sensor domain DACNV-containing protein [Bryobacteraceae bacterium]
MKPEAAYPAARIVSPKVHAYFTRQRAELVSNGDRRLATLPDIADIQAMVDAAFWASLRREESFIPKISLAFVAPEETKNALLLERPLPLDSGLLTKVSPAVERPGIHLGVSPGPDGLVVWGATRAIPSLCLVVEVAAPGLIVIKHHSSETKGKFVNVAVLEGDQVKIIDGHSASIPDCPAILTALLGPESPSDWVSSVTQPLNVLVQLAISMRSHGRGGSLLVVPSPSEAWRESIVLPIPYAVSPPFSTLAESARASNEDGRLNRAVDAVAGLTAVDGAVVLTDQYQVLGFGAKITRRRGHDLVDQVMVTEPIEGGAAMLVHPDKLGGTRHLSAAQFVQDQHDSAALVASQDGRFTVFEWSSCEGMVHAHRIEALLL